MGFTQVYSVAQTTCNSNYTSSDAPGDSLGPNSGPTNNNNYSLGTNTGSLGTAFGEVASVANGLTTAPITKVVITQLAGSSDAFGNSNESGSNPTGTFGIKIVNSAGTTKYTFSSTFAASATGFTNICQGIYGWTNITLTDTSNSYTMVAGDAILVTWSGTGNNVALVSKSIAGTYGKAVSLSGTTLTTYSGNDLAATLYINTVNSVAISEPSISVTDSLVRKLKRRKTMAENATITETRKKMAVHKRADILSIGESEAKIRRVPRTQSDILSIVDPIQKLVNHRLTQATGAITDSLKKKAVHMLADTLPLVEAIKKKAVHKIAEAVGSVTDSLGRFKKGIKSFTDSGPITVSFEKKKNANPQLTLDDEIPIVDVVTKYANKKAFAESLGVITQQTTPTKGRALLQPIGAITDAMKKKAVKSISEFLGISISETFQKMHLGRPHITEPVGAITDSLLKHHRFLRGLTELLRTIRSG